MNANTQRRFFPWDDAAILLFIGLLTVLVIISLSSCGAVKDALMPAPPHDNGPAHVDTKPPATNCDARVVDIRPVIGQRCDLDTAVAVGIKEIDPFTLLCGRIAVTCKTTPQAP